MPTVQVEAHLSPDDLLRAVQQLESPELEQFLARVVALRAQRQAPHLAQAETELLVKINRGLPDDLRQRHDSLAAKRDQETLTPDEHAELLRLTAQIEQLQADRIAALSALAELRGKPLTGLMDDLGLRAPADG
jgi:hypothetical protein